MPLPPDFQTFIAPSLLRHDVTWHDLVRQRHAAYQRRYAVHGLRDAAGTLGLHNARALWTFIDGIAGARKGGLALPAILEAVPPQWIADLPDVNDRGDAPAHTTYWREFSLPQLLNAWQSKAQSLPKALLSLAALAVAAGGKCVGWDQLMEDAPVCINPSVFWLIDYTADIYDRYIGVSLAATREAYAACGIDFDLGPNQRATALFQAAMGKATLTFATAERLHLWLEAQGVASGPVRVASNAYRLPAAAEVPAQARAAAACSVRTADHPLNEPAAIRASR